MSDRIRERLAKARRDRLTRSIEAQQAIDNGLRAGQMVGENVQLLGANQSVKPIPVTNASLPVGEAVSVDAATGIIEVDGVPYIVREEVATFANEVQGFSEEIYFSSGSLFERVTGSGPTKRLVIEGLLRDKKPFEQSISITAGGDTQAIGNTIINLAGIVFLDSSQIFDGYARVTYSLNNGATWDEELIDIPDKLVPGSSVDVTATSTLATFYSTCKVGSNFLLGGYQGTLFRGRPGAWQFLRDGFYKDNSYTYINGLTINESTVIGAYQPFAKVVPDPEGGLDQLTEPGDITDLIIRSVDAGQTWASIKTNLFLDDPNFEDETGAWEYVPIDRQVFCSSSKTWIICAYKGLYESRGGAPNLYRSIGVLRSEDDGVTWDFVDLGSLLEPSPIPLTAGYLFGGSASSKGFVLVGSKTNAELPQDIENRKILFSSDGLSWIFPTFPSGFIPAQSYFLSNIQTWLVVERTGQRVIYSDDGLSWSLPLEVKHSGFLTNFQYSDVKARR